MDTATTMDTATVLPSAASSAEGEGAAPCTLDKEGMAGELVTSVGAGPFVPASFNHIHHHVPIIDGVTHPPALGASILIIKAPWIDMLLDGHKTLEIRGTSCKKPAGLLVFLALSGGGGVLCGGMTFLGCHGPLSVAEYHQRREGHRVAEPVTGDIRPYGAKTYGWEFAHPFRFTTPIPYHHRHGAITWAKYS